jgi:hypothetical protein
LAADMELSGRIERRSTGRSHEQSRPAMSASLIGGVGSNAFRLSTTTVSMP